MMRYLFLLTWVFVSCAGPTKQEELMLRQKTSDSSLLFFKNLRKSNYQLQEMDAAGMNIYTHRDLLPEMPMGISIIHHWRDDRASVMLNFNGIQAPVKITSGGTEIAVFTGENISNHLEVATEIFRWSSSAIEFQAEGTSFQWADHPELREAFRISMIDFFNLTDNQRFMDSLK